MAFLDIRTLGGVTMTLGGRAIQDTLSNKSIALITLLLTGEGMRVRKSRLTALLWENSDEEACKNNLRYNLWSIKKVIVADEAGEEFIGSDKSGVFINPDYDFTADILKLKRFDAKKPAELAVLLEIKALFRGDYLEGFYLKDCGDYAETIVMERISCQNLQTTLLECLYNHYRAHGAHEQCVEMLSESLSIDPYNEHYALMMMKTLLCQGKNAQAVTFYKSYTGGLRRHLNIRPPEELTALFRSIEQAGAEVEPAARFAPAGGQALELDCACLPGADFYWMAEALAGLHRAFEASFSLLGEARLADLALVWPAMGVPPASIPERLLGTRLLCAFYALLQALPPAQPLLLRVDASRAYCAGLEAFRQLLERRPLPSVEMRVVE